MPKIAAAFPVAAALLAASGASAGIVTATVTADNHYSIYSTVGGSFVKVGGNETGAAGAPGRYNWSMAESYTFDASGPLYIAAWSDDATAQGLLAQIDAGDLGTIYSGDYRWQVFATGIDLDTGAPHPLAADVAAQIALADANDWWADPYVGETNASGTLPWAKIAGISDDANWMWNATDGGDALRGGKNHDEYLIFRLAAIPAPASGVVLAGAGLVLARRRR
ncbi:MAG: hypothetical protein ACTS27_05795 [Phycisphaerales bacterium]